MKRTISMISLAALLLAACSPSQPTGPQIRIESARVSPALTGMSAGMSMPGMSMPGMDMSSMAMGDITTAAYLVIVNAGNGSDALLGASSDAAKSVELHETRIENNVASMYPIAQVEIPQQSRVEFKPGARHLMLMGVTHDLVAGQQIQVTLRFAKTGSLTVNVPVQAEPNP